MAAGLALVYANELDTTVTASQATTETTTPAVGDIFFCSANASNGADPTLSGGGLTWTHIATESDGANGFVNAFRATSGTPSTGALTFGSSDNFRDMAYALVRPTDLTYSGVAGADNATAADTLSTTLTTSPAAALLGYIFARGASLTFTLDPDGWTELDQGTNAAGMSHQTVMRLSDDSALIADASANADMYCVCIEFAAVGGGSSAVPIIYQLITAGM